MNNTKELDRKIAILGEQVSRFKQTLQDLTKWQEILSNHLSALKALDDKETELSDSHSMLAFKDTVVDKLEDDEVKEKAFAYTLQRNMLLDVDMAQLTQLLQITDGASLDLNDGLVLQQLIDRIKTGVSHLAEMY